MSSTRSASVVALEQAKTLARAGLKEIGGEVGKPSTAFASLAR